MGRSTSSLEFLVPRKICFRNQGFETLAVAPPDSSLEGAIMAVSEKSQDK
jgi:hypothetical protein